MKESIDVCKSRYRDEFGYEGVAIDEKTERRVRSGGVKNQMCPFFYTSPLGTKEKVKLHGVEIKVEFSGPSDA